MSKISIVDLEVFFNVGVSDEERAKPQRLLLTVEMEFDFAPAAISDRVTKTIDYFTVSEHLVKFGERRSWKLIEKLASDLADEVLSEFHPQSVTMEVKKFALPHARYVAATLIKTRSGTGMVKKAAWGIP